jgi:hypothetical protein
VIACHPVWGALCDDLKWAADNGLNISAQHLLMSGFHVVPYVEISQDRDGRQTDEGRKLAHLLILQ